MSIRTRILLLMLAVLVPAAAGLAWLLASDLRHARESAYARVRVLADGTAAGVGGALQRGQAVLARMADRHALRTQDPQACDHLMTDLAALSPEYLRLIVLDLQGRPICAQAGLPVHIAGDEERTRLVAAMRSDGFAVSEVFEPRASGQQIVVLSQPLLDSAGQLLGVLYLDVDLLTLNRQLLGAVPPEAVVTVLDSRGTVALRSARAEAFIGTRAPGSARGLDVFAAQAYFDAEGRDGLRRLFATAALPAPGWRVFAGLPEAEVFAEYRQALTRTVVVGVGAALLALSLAFALSAAIARPIAQLRRSAAQVAGGDTSARAAIAGPPEVQLLAQTFNYMLDERTLVESRLQGIFDTALDAILTVGEDQRIAHANTAAATLLACPTGSLIGSPLERFIPQAARAAHPAAMRAFGAGAVAVAARHMGRPREVSALRADGSEFPAEATISHLSAGGARLYTVMLRDVTAVRQAEKALSDSEALLRRLLMNLPEAVFVSTADRISLINQAAQQLFGGDESVLLGRPALDLINPDSRPRVSQRMADLTTAHPVSVLADMSIVRLDGEPRTVETLCTLVEYDGERSIITVMRDVTQLRHAQADLEASHAELKRLVNALDRAQDMERRRISRELHDGLQQTLAAIRMEASMLRDGGPSAPATATATAARIDELAAEAITSTRRLISDLRPQVLDDLGLVQALRVLARAFSPHAATPCEVEVSDTDSWTEPPPQLAMGLYRVAQEALYNVAKHAQARHVRITLVSVGGSRWTLTVHDDGKGMSAHDRRKTRSFGLLGMQERVRALGGQLHIDSEPGRGTTLRASLSASHAGLQTPD